MQIADISTWMQTMLGCAVRGKTIHDMHAVVYPEGNIQIRCDMSDGSEVVASWDSVDLVDLGNVEWQYWDEFADREIADLENVVKRAIFDLTPEQQQIIDDIRAEDH